MANLIQIKRSLTTSVPGSLANGEQAYTANGDVLYIGSNAGVVAIGGKRVPGTLTANQAVVVNASSMIDQMIIGVTVSKATINSTGIHLSNTDGEGNTISITTPNTTEKGGNYYLKADGTWSTVTAGSAAPAGADTQVQYNDAGTTAGATGFTYNKTGNLVTISNTLYIGTGTANNTQNTTAIIIQSNSTHFARLTEGTLRLSNTVSNTQITIPTTTERSGSYFLKADGTWALVSANPGGADTQVLFNDGGSVSNGTAGFTFTKGTNNATIANTLTVGTTVINTAVISMAAGIQANTTALNPTANTILLGNTIGRWVITANSIATQGFAGNATHLNPTANTILLGNSIGLWVISANSVTTQGVQANSIALNPTANTILLGNSIGRWVISANTLDLTGVITSTSNVTTTGNVNAAIGYFTGLVNAAHFTTTGNANAAIHYAGANVFANATTMYVGNSISNTTMSNSGITSLGNTTTLATMTVNNAGLYIGNSSVTATGLTLTVANSASNTRILPNSVLVGTSVINATTLQVAGGAQMNATTLQVTDIVVSGNLDINGTLTTIDTTNMSVTDSIIQLARGNAGTTLDIGWVGNYNDGAARYAGMFWDQSNTAFELFSNTTVDLTSSTTIDPSGAGSVRGKLNAYLRTGWGSGLFEANATGTTITANSTWAVAITANTLSLTTQLAAGSGGTGQTTYADGDLLYGAGSALSKLTRGTDGKVLQSNATTITWADLDGGTF